ncbi:unnamed protein product, partial [Prorocentrum cordatum]
PRFKHTAPSQKQQRADRVASAEPPPPWHARKVAELEKQLAAAREQLATGGKTGSNAMEVDVDSGELPPQTTAQIRVRLDEIDEATRAIKDLKDPCFEKAREDLEAERKRLRVDLEASKPVPAQLRSLSFQSAKWNSKKEQLVVEAEQAILQIAEEQTRLASTVPRPPPSSTVAGELVAALGITVDKLGGILAGLGDDGQVQAKLDSALEEVRVLEERKRQERAVPEAAQQEKTEPQREAAPPDDARPAPGGVDVPTPDDTNLEELRAFLGRAGVAVQPEADEAAIRGGVRKLAEGLNEWRTEKRAKVQAGPQPLDSRPRRGAELDGSSHGAGGLVAKGRGKGRARRAAAARVVDASPLAPGPTRAADGRSAAPSGPLATEQAGSKGSLATLNCSSEKQLLGYMAHCSHTVVAVQEHHVAPDDLADAQHRLLDAGWQGIWAAADPTGNGGTQAGLAVLARPNVLITRGPCLNGQTELAGGRALPAQVHWGVPGGVVLVSVHLYVNEG